MNTRSGRNSAGKLSVSPIQESSTSPSAPPPAGPEGIEDLFPLRWTIKGMAVESTCAQPGQARHSGLCSCPIITPRARGLPSCQRDSWQALSPSTLQRRQWRAAHAAQTAGDRCAHEGERRVGGALTLSRTGSRCRRRRRRWRPRRSHATAPAARGAS